MPHHTTLDPALGDRIWINNLGRPQTPLFERMRWRGQPPEIRPTSVAQDNTRYHRVADLDGDGDLDVVETNFFEHAPGGGYVAENPRVFLNRRR